MNLSEKEVRYVADLANLRLSDEEVHRMSEDLGHILAHVEQLTQLDTKDVEPMAQVSDLLDAGTDLGHGAALRVDAFKLRRIGQRRLQRFRLL